MMMLRSCGALYASASRMRPSNPSLRIVTRPKLQQPRRQTACLNIRASATEGAAPLRAVEGDLVTLHWRCLNDAGEEVESSRANDAPTTFEVGTGDIVGNRLFEAFDEAVRGMAVGESVGIKVEGAPWEQDLLFRVPRDHMEIQRLEGRYKNQGGVFKGQIVELSNGGMAVIVECDEESVLIDANSMLAGKMLLFELELFSKILQEFAAGEEDSSALPDCFLSYKQLKKLLNAAAERQQQDDAQRNSERALPQGTDKVPFRSERNAQTPITDEEKSFITMLQQDLKRINAYFMEREEEAIIRLQHLSDRRAAAEAAGASAREGEAKALRAAFIDFHGELVLLLHWSLVNYAGTIKILKKHDKLLGGHTQKAMLSNVLHQPFTSTESISRLVKEAEEHVKALSETPSAPDDGHNNEMDHASRAAKEAAIVKRTRAALEMLAQLQDTAHTPSTLLPSGVAAESKRQKLEQN